MSTTHDSESEGSAPETIALLQRRIAELEDLLSRNPTTGLPIRRIFDRALSLALRARSGSERAPLVAVGLLRLDGDYAKVKSTRDRSRALLYKSADRVREIIGDSIFQGDRLDEFLLILDGLPNLDAIELRADQIVEAVNQPHESPADDVRFGCFLGIAVHPEHGSEREELLGNADIALTESESTGAPFVLYDVAIGERYRRRDRIERALRGAIQGGFAGFQVHYQPFVDAGGSVVGSEALIRWHHEELGSVRPDQFIPIAEENGAVRHLGHWMLYHACRQLAAWHDEGLRDLYVSVNLAASQLKQDDLVERIGGVLESVGLDPARLTLELTESMVMEHPNEAIARMRDLRSMGIRLALDDFGTGYSSLAYLKQFPFDTLKIDRSFVTDVHTSRRSRELIRAIVAMARAFGMQPLAEGVQSPDERTALLDEGCDLFQGYLFSPAVPAEELAVRARRGLAVVGSAAVSGQS